MRPAIRWAVTSVALLVVGLSPASGADPKRYFDEDHYEPINGTRLHFRVRGYDKSNPYVLLLHGGPGASALEFYPWGKLLEKQLIVVYLDQRGCGLSERVRFAVPGRPTADEAKGFRFSEMVRDIECVRKALGVKKWFVLGFSFGGMVGLEYVTAQSEHVYGYIHMNGLISVPMVNEDWLDYAERAVKQTARDAKPGDRDRIREVLDNITRLRSMSPEDRNNQIGPLVISKITPERIRDRFPAANAYDARIDAEVLSRYEISPDKLGAAEPRAAIELNEDMAEREAISLFGDVRMPVLILSGAQDPIIPPKQTEMMHRMIPQSRLVVIQDAAHELYKDQPEKSADAVLRFAAASRPGPGKVRCH